MPRGYPPLTEEIHRRFEEICSKNNKSKIKNAVEVINEFGLLHKPQTIVDMHRLWQYSKEIKKSVPPFQPRLPPEMAIQWPGPTMIWADVHMPYHHESAIKCAMMQAKREKIENLVLLGDYTDQDGFSTYSSMTAPQSYPELLEQLDVIYEMNLSLAKAFKQIFVVCGNHDERVLKKLGKMVGLGQFWNMISAPQVDGDDRPSVRNRFRVTDRYYMRVVDSPTGEWRLTHQREYRRSKGSAVRQLARDLQVNVVTSHEHHKYIGDCGTVNKNYAIAPGWMGDVEKIEYKKKRDSTHPLWDVAWVVLDEYGVPHVHDYEEEYQRWGL